MIIRGINTSTIISRSKFPRFLKRSSRGRKERKKTCSRKSNTECGCSKANWAGDWLRCTMKDSRCMDNLVALHFKYDQARRRFVEWAQNEIAAVPDFHKLILFSDEAHFWLNGYVNKQNCRIWSEPNPQVYVETPLHPEKLTVWCALWAGGILLQKR
ncbi:hypothetical protein TNCV_3995601 [Trichonephila clavipes]|nr:hypothetical protein TNCV_3995601 [Trichonephila clavipes]